MGRCTYLRADARVGFVLIAESLNVLDLSRDLFVAHTREELRSETLPNKSILWWSEVPKKLEGGKLVSWGGVRPSAV